MKCNKQIVNELQVDVSMSQDDINSAIIEYICKDSGISPENIKADIKFKCNSIRGNWNAEVKIVKKLENIN